MALIFNDQYKCRLYWTDSKFINPRRMNGFTALHFTHSVLQRNQNIHEKIMKGTTYRRIIIILFLEFSFLSATRRMFPIAIHFISITILLPTDQMNCRLQGWHLEPFTIYGELGDFKNALENQCSLQGSLKVDHCARTVMDQRRNSSECNACMISYTNALNIPTNTYMLSLIV